MKKNKTSFFYNKYSQEVIHTSCEYYQFAEWGIKNSEMFFLDPNHETHQFNDKKDSKIFKSAIYKEGWSYVYVHDGYCVIGGLNLEVCKKLLEMVTIENDIERANLEIWNVNSVFLEKDDIKNLLNTGEFGNHLFNIHLEKNVELNQLIKDLKSLDCSEQIGVFGSIVQGKIVPPDLDIWINATKIPINDNTQKKILALVEKYSLRLDPYIRTKDTILGVDSNVFTYEFNWIDLESTDKNNVIQNFDRWEKNFKNGIPINDLKLLPTQIEDLLNCFSVEKKLKIKM